MRQIIRFWTTLILDMLGVLLMLAAIATGWLPGPGGIPLFILGLSLLAINHDWAKRYIDLLKKYADRVGEMIFVQNSRVQMLYDVAAPAVILIGSYLLYRHSAIWMVSLGIFSLFIGLTFILGNRNRWQNIRARFKKS